MKLALALLALPLLASDKDKFPTIHHGYVDVVNCEFIAGWAAYGPPWRSVPMMVTIWDGNVDIFEAESSLTRKDIGKHAFHMKTPESLKDGRLHFISVTFEPKPLLDIPESLNGSGRALRCE